MFVAVASAGLTLATTLLAAPTGASIRLPLSGDRGTGSLTPPRLLTRARRPRWPH